MNRPLTHATLTTLLSVTCAAYAACSNPRYDLEPLAFQTALRYDIPAALFVAMIGTESHFCTQAVSPKGALGLGQIMPATARDLGLTRPFDPADNLDAAARYLRSLFQIHHTWNLSLAAYNAGSGNVTRFGGIPPFTETQNHVALILLRATALNAQIPLTTVLNTTPQSLSASLSSSPQSARPQLLAASQARTTTPPPGPTAPKTSGNVRPITASTGAANARPTQATAIPPQPTRVSTTVTTRPSPVVTGATLQTTAPVVTPGTGAGLATIRPVTLPTSSGMLAGLTVIRPATRAPGLSKERTTEDVPNTAPTFTGTADTDAAWSSDTNTQAPPP